MNKYKWLTMKRNYCKHHKIRRYILFCKHVKRPYHNYLIKGIAKTKNSLFVKRLNPHIMSRFPF